MAGRDLACEVTPAEPIILDPDNPGPRVVAIDTGIKGSIVRNLRERGVRLELHPCSTSATELLDRNPDAVFLANGPGGQRTIDTDEAVRWDTDFGVAELQQLNLYDRTVEGLVLRDVEGSTVQYHPEAGPGPHDALHLFDRFLERLVAA